MKRAERRYIFVTGGVLSGLGKGIAAASVGAILQARGLKVSIQKCDPYLNVDAGTLNPAEHGECFVTKDGAETDLDLGHYERFLDIELTQSSSSMSGRLLRQLIEDERNGKFLGKTLQLIPHFTNAIQEAIKKAADEAESDVHIVEIGGTVGDIEGLAFIEAIREMAGTVGRQNCLFIHLVYLPFLGTSKEFKSKPAQNAVREIRSLGIIPDIIFARSEEAPSDAIISKLGMFAGLSEEAVVSLPNAKTVYQVPLTLEEHGVGDLITEKLKLKKSEAHMQKWRDLVVAATATYPRRVRVGIVAKYLDNDDTYFSVVESLRIAAWKEKVQLELEWVDAEQITASTAKEILSPYDAVLVPGGFGSRGIEGKILAAQYTLEHNVPYLGLCLGLQVAVIAATRMAGVTDAHSTEVELKAKNDVIYIMPDQRGKQETGGTMRLGNYECHLTKGSLAHKLYEKEVVTERHRHRYEVNQSYKKYFEKTGVIVSGVSPDGKLVEVIEHTSHPFFIATQAHPEFRSRPNRPHPLFRGFLHAARR